MVPTRQVFAAVSQPDQRQRFAGVSGERGEKSKPPKGSVPLEPRLADIDAALTLFRLYMQPGPVCAPCVRACAVPAVLMAR